ncbi:NUDIX hydrolase [Hyphomicrobium sp.]|uniref:NUDIX hydrolase n=1 Tax=Hyphomicrobium sp. TaxID=82 RepID=UPI002E3249B3|nr:NUDIX hydrolase [Hyphomicrobium sp.]HEX2840462.1 NUDIX hydrolase [Hyphomicrobium sp.]
MRKQVGALPIRPTNEGRLEVLLVSSRETRRWVIPKGWPSKKLADHKAAAREANEEAGVTGTISPHCIGSYVYRKTTGKGAYLVEVSVYPLTVSRQRKSWAEKRERVRGWFDTKTASRMVREPKLRKMIADLPKIYSHPDSDRAASPRPAKSSV